MMARSVALLDQGIGGGREEERMVDLPAEAVIEIRFVDGCADGRRDKLASLRRAGNAPDNIAGSVVEVGPTASEEVRPRFPKHVFHAVSDEPGGSQRQRQA